MGAEFSARGFAARRPAMIAACDVPMPEQFGNARQCEPIDGLDPLIAALARAIVRLESAQSHGEDQDNAH